MLGRPLALRMVDLESDITDTRRGKSGQALELQVADIEADIEKSELATQQLLDQGVEMVMASCTMLYGPTAIREVQLAGKIAFSSCAFHPNFSITHYAERIFSIMLGPEAQGATMAEWAFKDKGWRNVYLVKNLVSRHFETLCDSFKARWQELGGTVTGENSYKSSPERGHRGQTARMKSHGDADFAFLCTASALPHRTSKKILVKNTGSLFINGMSFAFDVPGLGGREKITLETGNILDGLGLVKSIRTAGIDIPLVAAAAMDGDFWLADVPNLSDFYVGVYGSKFGNDPDPRINDFVCRYTELYGMAPTSSHALLGYSQVEAWAIAAERAGSLDADAIARELDKFDNEPLLIGPTTFTTDHQVEPQRGMLIMEVRNGKHIPLTRYVAE